METIISIFNNILGIYTWLEQKIGKTKAIIVLSYIILIGAVFSIRSYFPKVEEIQKQPEISRNQTIQDNHGTINNIENQTINNNYATQMPDNKIVVKKEKQNIEEIFLEISIRLPSKTKGYNKILVNGKEAIILDSSPLNPFISIKSQYNVNQHIMIITKSRDTCNIIRVFDVNSKNNFPPNFIPECID